MIGKLSGVIDSVGEHSLVLDVGGVGYLVECSAKTLATIPAPNEEVSLIIEMYVREQEIKLFGFLREEERCWFRLLIAVQGVGNKVAMTVLGLFEAEELAHAILTKDKAAITRTPGIGDKVAS
ncbi:MAG: Holliday junction branch migration protein RuvA, partial [Parvibaculales bacterium]